MNLCAMNSQKEMDEYISTCVVSSLLYSFIYVFMSKCKSILISIDELIYFNDIFMFVCLHDRTLGASMAVYRPEV